MQEAVAELHRAQRLLSTARRKLANATSMCANPRLALAGRL